MSIKEELRLLNAELNDAELSEMNMDNFLAKAREEYRLLELAHLRSYTIPSLRCTIR